MSHGKKAGRYTYVEVDYNATKEEVNLENYVADASIHPAIAHLISFIFNVRAMEKVLLEYSVSTYIIGIFLHYMLTNLSTLYY